MRSSPEMIDAMLYHFLERTYQSETIERGTLTKNKFIEMLKKQIEKTPVEMVKSDAAPFVKNPKEMEIWTTGYFLELADRVQFLET